MDDICFCRFYRGWSTHIFCQVLRKTTKTVVSWVKNPKIEARIRLSMPKTDLTTIFDHTDGLGSFFKLFGSNLQLSFLSSRGDDFRVMCFWQWS